MRLTIEIIAALLLLVCVSASSAASAAGKGGRSADGLSRAFGMPETASLATRCAAVQCRGKFCAHYCGDKMLADM